MAKFRVTLQLDVEVDDNVIENPTEEAEWIDDEMHMGIVEAAKKLEDNELGRHSNYQHSVVYLEEK